MKQINHIAAPAQTLRGYIRVPGDKSVSHRAVVLSAVADGTSRLRGFLDGADCMATVNAFRAMGARIEGPADGVLTVHGVGIDGLQAPTEALDMGNSGTAMRLLAGLLAGQGFAVTLTGDESLLSRPMRRVAEPIRAMGGDITTTRQHTAPITLRGGRLKGIDYRPPVASAQVKSCVLLAGLYAQGTTTVAEPTPTRDHTERMLTGFRYPVAHPAPGTVRIIGGGRLCATDIDIPADISSAAFFIVAAVIAKDADITLRHVGINPTRVGVIDILKDMGADITLLNRREISAEPVADIRARSSTLRGVHIDNAQVAAAIDEFPALFIAAACARGDTVLSGAAELRVKESDRIGAMADGLTALGVVAVPSADGITITGGDGDDTCFNGGEVQSRADHRIAMAFSVAAARAAAPIHVRDCANVGTSFPGFVKLANQVGLNIRVEEQ